MIARTPHVRSRRPSRHGPGGYFPSAVVYIQGRSPRTRLDAVVTTLLERACGGSAMPAVRPHRPCVATTSHAHACMRRSAFGLVYGSWFGFGSRSSARRTGRTASTAVRIGPAYRAAMKSRSATTIHDNVASTGSIRLRFSAPIPVMTHVCDTPRNERVRKDHGARESRAAPANEDADRERRRDRDEEDGQRLREHHAPVNEEALRCRGGTSVIGNRNRKPKPLPQYAVAAHASTIVTVTPPAMKAPTRRRLPSRARECRTRASRQGAATVRRRPPTRRARRR